MVEWQQRLRPPLLRQVQAKEWAAKDNNNQSERATSIPNLWRAFGRPFSKEKVAVPAITNFVPLNFVRDNSSLHFHSLPPTSNAMHLIRFQFEPMDSVGDRISFLFLFFENPTKLTPVHCTSNGTADGQDGDLHLRKTTRKKKQDKEIAQK